MVKVTGIDIGTQSIHLLELDGSGRKYRVTKELTYPRTQPVTPEGSEEPVVDPQLLVDDLKAAFHEGGFTRDRAFLAVSGADCILRNITLPFRGREEIRKILKFEAESYIHSHSIDDVVVDAMIIQEREAGTELFMAGCPKDVLRGELHALNRVGVDPEFADLSTCLLVEAARSIGLFEPADDQAEAGPGASIELIVDVGARSVQLALVRDGQLVTSRVLRWGTLKIEHELAERLSITPAEMRTAFAAYYGEDDPGIDEGVDAEDGEDGMVQVATPVKVQESDLVDASRNLAGKVMREVRRFLSGIDIGGEPRRILLTGGGSRMPGLGPSLEAESQVVVEPLDLIGETGAGETDRPELDLAFAAALAGVGATKPVMNFRQEEVAFRPKFDRLKLPLAITFLTLAIFLLFLCVREYQHIQKFEAQVGIIEEPKKKKKRVGTRGKRLPGYTGLLRQIAHPDRQKSYLQHYLREEDSQPILKALPSKDVFKRPRFIKQQLVGVRKKLQRLTGYFAEIKLESGLAVLQKFSEVIDVAAKDPAIERFVIPKLHIQVGAKRKQGGFLKFMVVFRGEEFRTYKDMFVRHFQRACGKDGPFKAIEPDGTEKVNTGLNSGAEYNFRVELNDEITVFQPKKT